MDARSTLQGNSNFVRKIKAKKRMIPPHPSQKICNLILIALYPIVLQVVLVIIVIIDVSKILGEDCSRNHERKRKNLLINKIVIYFPQLLQFTKINAF